MPDTMNIDLGHLAVEHLARMGIADEEECWLGTVYILGTPMHFQAIRVEQDSDGIWRGTKDPFNRLDDVYGVYDAAPRTTQIPGLDGEYVVLIHPYGD